MLIVSFANYRMSSQCPFTRFTLLNESVDQCFVFDTVPVAVTLSQLGCGSLNSSEDLHMRAMAKQDLPKRYHFSNNRRIDDIVLDIDDEYVAARYDVNSSGSISSHHVHHYYNHHSSNYNRSCDNSEN